MSVQTDNQNFRVVFSDGEGVDPIDFTRLQNFIVANLYDNMIASMVPDGIGDATDAAADLFDLEGGENWNGLGFGTGNLTGLALAPAPGGGYFKAGGGARTLVSVGGPLLFVVDEPFSGNDESIAPFRLPGNITLTTAIGDATHPRIDVIEAFAQFVNVAAETRDFEDETSRAKTTTTMVCRRQVQLTVQIKQGTPSATPAYPALTGSGFAPLCAVYVPATHNAVHSPNNIRDTRMPLGGVQVFDVPASSMVMPGDGSAGAHRWTTADDNVTQGVLAGLNNGPAANTGKAYAWCPVGGKNARLIGLGVYATGANLAKLVSVDHTASSVIPLITELADLSDLLVGSGGPGMFRTATMVQLMEALGGAASTVVKGTRAADTYAGTPMWCSGWPAGLARPRTVSETPFRRLAVEITGDAGDQLSFVRFVVASGM